MNTERTFSIFTEREVDGRWIAGVKELSGVLAYGPTRDQAVRHVIAVALRILADNLERKKTSVEKLSLAFSA